ncbi:hypothetical protein QFC22_004652 [Naganishia vaughanmartiniae]|uniref:Uncharacterized protein n=1 Tax=Naganishia vaughanmartiniae TaxID=1424756 RepID=A0ACC2WYV9_9TREE|nr:hypothetical protein QFC22_004652 [Naganishia vaughanmartiniae]
MHRPTRRLRFYKPEGSDVNPLANNPPPSEEPSAPAICVKASRRRWTDSISAPRSSDAQSSSQQPSVATGTPISKGTPETLRTLELNWRDRRRAKLEDITLQRVMGVEKGGDLHAEIAQGKTRKHVEVRSQPPADRPIKQSTRPEQEQPSEAIASSSRVGRRINGLQTQAVPSSSNVNSPAELVRDARLSVQGNEKRTSTTVTPAVKAQASRRNLADPLENTLNPALGLPSSPASCLPPSLLPSSAKRPSAIVQGTATPRRISILREPSSWQTDDAKQSSSRQSTSSSIRSAVHNRRYTNSLYPITVSPLPAREYPLSSTATLIVYAYEQDWSVNIPSQDGSPEGQSGSSRSRPVMSALTASERIDILDEGNTMRIKSRLKGSAKVKPSRYLRFGERDRWSEADRRRWTLSQILVDRLKRRTRRVCSQSFLCPKIWLADSST